MQLISALLLALSAATTLAQGVTLQPTTIRGPTRPVQCPVTVTETSKVTVTYSTTMVLTSIKTVTSVSVTTSTTTTTTTSRQTVTTTKPCADNCPTLTSTATACRTCLNPGCTDTVIISRPAGCTGPLPTTSIDLGCNVPNVCNKIGCKTVYVGI